MFSVTGPHPDPIMTHIVDGKALLMEVDTGAKLSKCFRNTGKTLHVRIWKPPKTNFGHNQPVYGNVESSP